MKQLSQTVEFDSALLNKYNQPLPRYTSYPPATELSTDFDRHAFKTAIAVGNHKQTPLSLYCHIPFCETPCYFCGCNTIITQRKEVVEPYLGYLDRQIRRRCQFGGCRSAGASVALGRRHAQLSRSKSIDFRF
jgi:oxygen-independent coproporphyrinogen-3 oxidase